MYSTDGVVQGAWKTEMMETNLNKDDAVAAQNRQEVRKAVNWPEDEKNEQRTVSTWRPPVKAQPQSHSAQKH